MPSPTDRASARQRFQGPVLRTGVCTMTRSSNPPTLNPTPAPPHPPEWPYHWPSQLVEVSHLHPQPPENNLCYLHLVFTARNKSYLLFLWAMKTWKTIPWRKATFSAVISLCSNRFRGIFAFFAVAARRAKDEKVHQTQAMQLCLFCVDQTIVFFFRISNNVCRQSTGLYFVNRKMKSLMTIIGFDGEQMSMWYSKTVFGKGAFVTIPE